MSDIANIECFDAWNGDSGHRWADEADRRDSVLAPVADVLFDAAHLQPGEHVLDLGCGCGATTLRAAHAVGEDGFACGLDLSAPMLDIARQRRDTAGVANAEFVQGDAQTQRFDTISDVAVSRFGTMFFADPVAAFTNIARGIAPGGRMCLATWQPLAANDWLTIPGAALLRYGSLPAAAACGPGMFGQCDPDTVTSTLQAAGYGDIELRPVTITMRLGSDVDVATNYLASSGVGRAVLETVASEQRAAAIDAVRAVLRDHADDDGVRLDGAIWIIGARRLG